MVLPSEGNVILDNVITRDPLPEEPKGKVLPNDTEDLRPGDGGFRV